MADLALVTGASSGLGEHFARELAARGHDLVLVARRKDRLQKLAKELKERHGISVTVIASDLSSEEGCNALVTDLRSANLKPLILINNAGYGHCGLFSEGDDSVHLGMISLNVMALVWLTRQLLVHMRQIGRGYILNVASVAAFQPGPGMSTYFATKAFVLSFSEALHEELFGDNIHVSCLCPGTTRTEFFEVAKAAHVVSAPGVMEALPVVRAGLAGLWSNQAIVIPGWANWILVQCNRFLPRFLVRKLAKEILMNRFLRATNSKHSP